MIIQLESPDKIRPDQVRAMAQGLYYLAGIDGITEKEKDLIRDLLKEGELELDNLAKIPFSLEGLKQSLDTMFLRRTFLKIAMLMAQADGEITKGELAELRRLAQALDVTEALETMTADLEGKTLE